MSTNNDWIKMSERKPTEADLPIWLYTPTPLDVDNNLGMPIQIWMKEVPRCLDFTHWRPAKPDIPAPPAPEPTQREEDEAAALEYIRYNSWSAQSIWHAALAYRDAQNAKDLEDIYADCGSSMHRDAYKNLRRRCGLDK